MLIMFISTQGRGEAGEDENVFCVTVLSRDEPVFRLAAEPRESDCVLMSVSSDSAPFPVVEGVLFSSLSFVSWEVEANMQPDATVSH